MRLLPLRADASGKRFGSGCVALCRANAGAQRLQHFAIGFLFDACGQSCRLCGGAVQHAFDRCRIGLASEGSADLLRHRSAGRGILQGMRFLPLRADTGGKRFGSGCVALCGADAGAQRLQHFAIGFLFDACGQSCRLCGGAVQHAFDRCRIGLASEGSADLLRHRGAGRGILQRVRLLPLCANAGSKRFGGCCVALRGTDASAQRLQHLAVSFLFDASGQSCRLCGSAVQHAFDGCGICLATEGSADLLRHRGAGRRIL